MISASRWNGLPFGFLFFYALCLQLLLRMLGFVPRHEGQYL